jgi:hypothetical protein
VVGAVRVADHRYLADQLSFIMSAGIGGLGCIGFGAGLLLSADLHDEWRKLDHLEVLLEESSEGAGRPELGDPAATGAPAAAPAQPLQAVR